MIARVLIVHPTSGPQLRLAPDNRPQRPSWRQGATAAASDDWGAKPPPDVLTVAAFAPMLAVMMDSFVPKDDLLTGIKVLVVDDEADVRAFLVALLEDAGAETYEAQDGDEALMVAGRERPDLITLDLEMFHKNGLETFRELCSAAETESIPVCILTGHPELGRSLFDRPGRSPDAYLDKPIVSQRLLGDIRQIFDDRE